MVISHLHHGPARHQQAARLQQLLLLGLSETGFQLFVPQTQLEGLDLIHGAGAPGCNTLTTSLTLSIEIYIALSCVRNIIQYLLSSSYIKVTKCI